MKRKQVLASLLISAIALSNMPISAFAQTSGVGDTSATSDFDTTDYFDDSLIVMIPDEVSLTLNEETENFEGSGFVTAWGKAAASTVLSVSTDAEITYKNAKKNSITVNADVSFVDDTYTGKWNGETLNSNIDAESKAGYDVSVSAPLSEVDDIGTYTSIIPFNISVGRADDFTYYMGYKYTTVASYTDDDGSIQYEVLPSGDTVAELQAFSTDKQALIDAGYDKIVASTDAKLEIPSSIDGLDVVGVSFNSFFADEEISNYVTNITVPASVEGIELTDAASSTSQTVIDAYNYRASVKLSKSIPADAKIRFIFQDTEMFIYAEKTYNGVEGYTCFGFSSYGLSILDDLTGETVTVVIPETYNGKPVIALDFDAASTYAEGSAPFNKALGDAKYDDIEIVCGDNILYIEGGWNSGDLTDTLVSKITAIDLNDGVLRIENDAFNGVENLTTINFPASLTEIGDSAFMYATKLKNVTFEEGFNSDISDNAFYGTAIREITLPSSMTNIRADIFGFLGTKVLTIHFNNNASDVSVTGFGEDSWCVYLDFLDTDYIDYVNDSYKFVGTVTVDDGYTLFDIPNEAALSELGSIARKALSLNDFFTHVTLGKDITTLGVSLEGCYVGLPSTLTSITCSQALCDATIANGMDFRGVSFADGIYGVLTGVTAFDMYLYSSQLEQMAGGTSDIDKLYIEYDTVLSSYNSMSFSNIDNIYFSGTEEEWNTLSEKLTNISSFTGSIYYEQTF